jgi:hypothetical protein
MFLYRAHRLQNAHRQASLPYSIAHSRAEPNSRQNTGITMPAHEQNRISAEYLPDENAHRKHKHRTPPRKQPSLPEEKHN